MTVASTVATFVFPTLARTADQLQGIKKGVLELADIVVVDKADGEHARRPTLSPGESAEPSD